MKTGLLEEFHFYAAERGVYVYHGHPKFAGVGCHTHGAKIEPVAHAGVATVTGPA